MSLKVSCDQCGENYNLADSMAGKKVRCRECNNVIEIPAARSKEPPKPAATSKPRPKPVAKKRVEEEDEFLDDDDILEDDVDDFEEAPRRAAPRGGARKGKSRRKESSGVGVVIALAAAAVLVLVGAVYGIVVLVRGGGAPAVPQPVVVNPPAIPVAPQPVPAMPVPANVPSAATPEQNTPVPQPAPPTTPANVPNDVPNNVPPNVPAPAVPPNNAPLVASDGPVPGLPFAPPAQPALPPAAAKAQAQQEAVIGYPISPAGAKKPAGWAVSADPGPAAEKFDASKPVNVRIGQKPWQSEAIFPEQLSPFAAVGDDAKEVWDLRTDERIGFVTGLKSIRFFALSADGKSLATVHNKEIKLFDTKTGKVLKEGESPDGNLQSFGFAGPNRLVGISFFGEVIAWSVESLKVEFKTKLAAGANAQTMTISPGGKFLAAFAANKLIVGNLETGKPAGELTLPSVWQNNLNPNLVAMSFSPDGKELAMLFDAPFNKGSNLIVLDVESARTVSSLTFASQLANQVKRSGASEKPIVQWFPGGSKFLVYGVGVVDRASGGLVWEVPNDGKTNRDGPRRVLSDSLIAVVGGDNSNRSLTTVAVPVEELKRGAEMIAAGGLAIDAKLPPITKIDVAGTKLLDVASAGNWRFVPANVAPKPALLSQAIAIPFEGMVVQGAKHPAGSSSKLAVVEVAQGSLQNGTPVEQLLPHLKNLSGKRDATGPAATRLSLYDIATAGAPKVTLIDQGYELMSVAPSGSRVLLRLADGQDRLDLWDASTGKHELGWRPYINEERGQSPQQSKQAIDFAEFAGEDHVVTLSRNGRKLTVWKLPECRATFSAENVSLPQVTADGKAVVIAFAQTINLFDIATGTKSGTVLLNGTPQGFACSPDGSRLAVSYFAPGSAMMGIVDLASGQLTADFPLPTHSSRLHWCGADHVLIGDASLVDLKRELVIGSYSLPAWSQHLPDSPDGRHWYVTPRAANDMTMILTATPLPEPSLAQLVQQQNPRRETLLHPGASVGLQLSVFEPPTKPGFSNSLTQKLTDGFTKHQIKVDQNAPLVMSISMTERATGETDEYRSIGFRAGRGVTSVAVKEVECTVTFSQGGVKVAEGKTKYTNRGGFIEHLRDGESIEDHVNKRMYDNAANYLLNSPVPKFLFPPTAVTGLSRGVFDATGVKPAANPATPTRTNPRFPGLRT